MMTPRDPATADQLKAAQTFLHMIDLATPSQLMDLADIYSDQGKDFTLPAIERKYCNMIAVLLRRAAK